MSRSKTLQNAFIAPYLPCQEPLMTNMISEKKKRRDSGRSKRNGLFSQSNCQEFVETMHQSDWNHCTGIFEFIFPEVIIGVQDVFIKKGYQVLIMQSNESYENEMANIKTMENNMVDGLIISLSKESKNVDYLKGLVAKGFPLVLFNRVSDET